MFSSQYHKEGAMVTSAFTGVVVSSIIFTWTIATTAIAATFIQFETTKPFGYRTVSSSREITWSQTFAIFENKMEAQTVAITSTRTNNTSASNQQSNKLPIYITIGPQGSGKTTYLSNLKRIYEGSQLIDNSTISSAPPPTTLEDITIDDQDGVYIPTPIELWLINHPPSLSLSASSKYSNSSNIQSINSYLQTNIHGKTISQRIYNDNHEMKIVIQRLNSILSASEFRTRVMSLDDEYMDKKTNSSLMQLCKKQKSESISLPYDWKERLIHIVEEFHRSELKFIQDQKSNVMQLFVVESIFKTPTPTLQSFLSCLSSSSSNNTNNDNNRHSTMNAINTAKTKLEQYAQNEPHVALAWGNTNTKVGDYIAALEAAEQSQRPVVFIPYLNNRQVCSINDDGMKDNNEIFVPSVEINELLRRNIKRCYTTGKYVPVKAIVDTCLRVDELMEKAMDKMQGQFDLQSRRNHKNHTRSNYTSSSRTKRFSKQQLDYALAKMAGFNMDYKNKTVRKFDSFQSNQRQRSSNTNANRNPK